jgi:hypothetical protein
MTETKRTSEEWYQTVQSWIVTIKDDIDSLVIALAEYYVAKSEETSRKE